MAQVVNASIARMSFNQPHLVNHRTGPLKHKIPCMYFNNEIEQTLLIGEEIEVGNNSDSDDGSSDCNDSDSDTDYSTDDIT